MYNKKRNHVVKTPDGSVRESVSSTCVDYCRFQDGNHRCEGKIAAVLHATTVGVVAIVGDGALIVVGEAAIVEDTLIEVSPVLFTVGEASIVAGESTKVEGKASTLIAPCSFKGGGGGMSESPILRFLPFGAGSSGGDLLYVTVLVITDRTLTDLGQALLGVSK